MCIRTYVLVLKVHTATHTYICTYVCTLKYSRCMHTCTRTRTHTDIHTHTEWTICSIHSLHRETTRVTVIELSAPGFTGYMGSTPGVRTCVESEICTYMLTYLQYIHTYVLNPCVSYYHYKVPQEFLKSCFDRMQRIWASLVAYKKGEFQEEEESKGNKDGYQRKVVELTRCLAFLREYAAEVDDCYPDERAYPPHGKLVLCVCVCVCVYLYAFVHVCVYFCALYIRMYVHMYVCVCLSICV